jgi:hypothetical protein
MRRYFEEVAASDTQSADKVPSVSSKLFDESSLLHEVLRLVEQYASHESKHSAEDYCDNTLVGLLELTHNLLEGAHLKNLKVFEGP